MCERNVVVLLAQKVHSPILSFLVFQVNILFRESNGLWLQHRDSWEALMRSDFFPEPQNTSPL